MNSTPINPTGQGKIPDHDLSIADLIRITGLSRNRAYRLRYWGEYRVGTGQKATRRIRREEFLYRRNNGLNIAVEG